MLVGLIGLGVDYGRVLSARLVAQAAADAAALAAAHPNGPDTMILFPAALSAIVPGYGTWDLAFAADLERGRVDLEHPERVDRRLPAQDLADGVVLRLERSAAIAGVLAPAVPGARVRAWHQAARKGRVSESPARASCSPVIASHFDLSVSCSSWLRSLVALAGGWWAATTASSPRR